MVSQGAILTQASSYVTITNTHFNTTGNASNQFPGSMDCESSGCGAGEYGVCELVGQCYSCAVDVCHQCPPGKYSAAGASDCQPCEVGKFSNVTGRKSCDTCPSGHYASADPNDTDAKGSISGATSCVVCPAGTYQPYEKSYLCYLCSKGYSSAKGSSKCTGCDTGRYTSASGMSDCVACDSGKEASEPIAAFECDKCVSPMSSWAGEANCSICEENYYLDGECSPCPENAYCPLGTLLKNIHVDKGYWRVNTKAAKTRECTNTGAACKGGNGSSYCQDHSHGPYCAICDLGYWKASEARRCQSCADETAVVIDTKSGILLGIASIIVILLLVQTGLRYKRGTALGRHYMDFMENYSKLKTKLKIAATFAQIAVSFPQQFDDVLYPRAFLNVCNYLAFIFSLQIYPMIPTQCVMDTHRHMYLFPLLTQTLVPLAVIGLGFIYYAARRCLFARNDKRKILHLTESAMFWFLLFTYLIYPSCSSVVLAVYNCEDLGSGEKYMHADYSTPCNTKEYRWMQGYAAVFMFIYPLGCPLMYFVLMWHRRHEIDPVLAHTNKRARMTESPRDVDFAVALRLENHELAPLAFLFESYEPQFWFWEVLVCIERLLLTNADIYLNSQSTLRPFVVLVIAIVSVKLYSQLDPYIVDSDDLFAETKDWAIVSMVIFTIVLQVHEALGIAIPMGIHVMLLTAMLGLFGIFAYFCLTTIVAEGSFFGDVAAHMFPKTAALVERPRQIIKDRRRCHRRKPPAFICENGGEVKSGGESQGPRDLSYHCTDESDLAGSSVQMAVVFDFEL